MQQKEIIGKYKKNKSPLFYTFTSIGCYILKWNSHFSHWYCYILFCLKAWVFNNSHSWCTKYWCLSWETVALLRSLCMVVVYLLLRIGCSLLPVRLPERLKRTHVRLGQKRFCCAGLLFLSSVLRRETRSTDRVGLQT